MLSGLSCLKRRARFAVVMTEMFIAMLALPIQMNDKEL